MPFFPLPIPIPIPVLWVLADTVYRYQYNLGRAVSEIYLRPGEQYLGSKRSIKRRNPTFSTSDRGWSSRTVNSKILSVVFVAFGLFWGNLSRRWKAVSRVCCWTPVLADARFSAASETFPIQVSESKQL